MSSYTLNTVLRKPRIKERIPLGIVYFSPMMLNGMPKQTHMLTLTKRILSTQPMDTTQDQVVFTSDTT